MPLNLVAWLPPIISWAGICDRLLLIFFRHFPIVWWIRMKTSNIPKILQIITCKRRCKLLAPGPLALSYIPFGLLNTAAVKTDSISVGIIFCIFYGQSKRFLFSVPWSHSGWLGWMTRSFWWHMVGIRRRSYVFIIDNQQYHLPLPFFHYNDIMLSDFIPFFSASSFSKNPALQDLQPFRISFFVQEKDHAMEVYEIKTQLTKSIGIFTFEGENSFHDPPLFCTSDF